MRTRASQERRAGAAGGERPRLRIVAAAVLSVALNALLVWGLWHGGAFAVPRATVLKPVALAPLTAAEWDANREVSGTPRAPPRPIPAPPPPAKPRSDDPKGQLVQLPPGAEEKTPPKDSRYVAERNQDAEKETVSRDAGTYPNLLSRPQEGAPERKGSGEDGRARAPVKGREGAPDTRGTGADRLALPEQAARDRLALAPAPGGEEPLVGERDGRQGLRGGGRGLEVPGGEGGERADGARVPDLAVTPDSLARIAGGPSLDGFEQAEEGDETRLRTRSWERAKYWNSVSRKIEADWQRRVAPAVLARDPNGETFFYKDRSVGIGIALDRDGRVADLRVLESSNVDFYDRIAMTSIMTQQPYPAPPREALGEDGTVRFGFTFTLYSERRRPSVFLRRFQGE